MTAPTTPLVYIAGPYTRPDPVANTRRAIAVGMGLYERTGCAVLIPHQSLLADFLSPRPLVDWYRFDLRLLEHCSAVYRLQGESEGADREVARAGDLGLPVFYEAHPSFLASDLLNFVTSWDPAVAR